MGLKTKIEAAIALGVEVELLEYFCTICPKPGEARVLNVVNTDQGAMVDDKDLQDFQAYLNAPWPLPLKGGRPHIPEPIKEDVRRESHYGCAICGHMDNGECAHIVAVVKSLNNSPDNLIYLCPNHHSKYDYGHKPSSNVTEDEVRAAKAIKRNSRQRMMRYEDNVTKALKSLLAAISRIKEALSKQPKQLTENLITIYETEAKALLEQVPELIRVAQEKAAKDVTEDVAEKVLAQKAPSFAKATLGIGARSSPLDIRRAVTQVSDIAEDILIDLNEVECPRCGGQGFTGIVGDFCAYCRGSCIVTREQAEAYDETKIDEVDCPHCHGRGTIGLDQHWCPYCKGSCFVSRDEVDEYDESKIDEVDCPHCHGRGTIGLDQHTCPFCQGACRITEAEAAAYDESKIDEVDCPHCHGRGTIGLDQHTCPFCQGACRITEAEAAAYDESKIDEVDCPHCNGNGVLGYDQHFCPFCQGACRITQAEANNYDEEQIDEVECPRCGGRGTTGHVGDICKLCHGASIVSQQLAAAYRRKYPI